MENDNRIIKWLCALIGLIIIGTLGYTFIENWDFFDSFYMTVITLTTVGFSETRPLSTAGRAFTAFLSLVGVGTVIFILTSLVQATFEGEFGVFRRHRMEEKIKKLNDHFILCGYGRVGEAIAATLKQQNASFVVIENNLSSYARAAEHDLLIIKDDGTNQDVLKHAQINKAKVLITAFGNDAFNTYAILTARELNPRLIIISRASNNNAAKRLKQAGANHIILPEVIGGMQMARLAMRPATIQFIETILSGNAAYVAKEVYIEDGSKLSGCTIREIEERFSNLRILAINEKQGELIINPATNTVIESRMELTVFGSIEQLHAIEECCSFDGQIHTEQLAQDI